MHRPSADRTRRPHIDREMSYRNYGIPKPRQVDAGSGRRRRSARRPGRDHRQRRPDGRGRVPHRDAAAPPSAPRRLPGAGVRQERKRQRELTDRLRPLTERREQLRLPGPVRPPHRCDHPAPASRGSTSTSTSTAAGWCGQTTPRAAQRGYQSSPRQPRQDRALGASASGANQPRAHGSTSPPPRLSPPPLSCHLARSRETAPPGDSGHEIRAWRAPDMRPELGKTRTCASTNAGLASRTGRVPQFASSATVADGGPFRACIGNRCAPPSPSIGRARLVLP